MMRMWVIFHSHLGCALVTPQPSSVKIHREVNMPTTTSTTLTSMWPIGRPVQVSRLLGSRVTIASGLGHRKRETYNTLL